MRICLLLVVLSHSLLAQPQNGGPARWIWLEDAMSPKVQDVVFHRTLVLSADPVRARAWFTCDNAFALWVNGQRRARGTDWMRGQTCDLTRALRKGENIIAIEGRNDGGPAGLLGHIEVVLPGGATEQLPTDASWRVAPRAEVENGWRTAEAGEGPWVSATPAGPLGSGPWTLVTWTRPSVSGVERFEPEPGFRVEIVAEDTGSLDAVCAGPPGTFFVAVEGDGVLALEDEDGDGAAEKQSWFTRSVRNAQGLLWLDDALLVVGEGPKGPGLYRVRLEGDQDVLGLFRGGMGEHGPHAVILGPDGRLYVILGNHTGLGEAPHPESPFRHIYEGHLLPRYVDPRGHATSIKAPGGTIASVNQDGTDWKLVAGGLRNAYDIAFDRHGNLFTYDSDMEWDAGLPWYRPTALYRVLPGADFGWRTGSTKWSWEFPDALPPILEVGRGSPVGLASYDHTRFPRRFRGALLGGDWSRGLILAWRLEPDGSSYRADTQVLLRGRPLNVTDLVCPPDGSVVFTTGGRGTQGGLYRLVATGPEEAGALPAAPMPLPSLTDTTKLADLAAALASTERTVRYAAARALERRPHGEWVAELTSHANPLVRMESLVALARGMLEASQGLHVADAMEHCVALAVSQDLPSDVRRGSLRALDLFLQGARARGDLERASPTSRAMGQRLLAIYPTADRTSDRELESLLAWLSPKGVHEALLARLEGAASRKDAIYVAYALRAVSVDWSSAQRLRFARWFRTTAGWAGGSSLQGYLSVMKADVEAGLSEEDRRALGEDPAPKVSNPRPLATQAAGPPRDLDRTWEVLEKSLHAERRSLDEGHHVFQRACAACHPFRGRGGDVGPDLSTIASRFSAFEILEAVMDPNRVISDQYRSLDVFTKDDEIHSGMPIVDDDRRLVLLDRSGKKVEISKGNVSEQRPSKTSAMPEGLLDGLTLEEVADLFAFMSAEDLPKTPKDSAYGLLFDGRTLAGWEGNPELWRVEQGLLVGELRDSKSSSFLISKDTWSDFTVELEIQLLAGNSGLQFRSAKVGDEFTLAGYQADLGQVYWGSLYEERGRGILLLAQRELWQTVLDDGGWNHLCVVARGDHFQIFLNGEQTIDFRDSKTSRGVFGLQLHGGMTTHLLLRHLRVRSENSSGR